MSESAANNRFEMEAREVSFAEPYEFLDVYANDEQAPLDGARRYIAITLDSPNRTKFDALAERLELNESEQARIITLLHDLVRLRHGFNGRPSIDEKYYEVTEATIAWLKHRLLLGLLPTIASSATAKTPPHLTDVVIARVDTAILLVSEHLDARFDASFAKRENPTRDLFQEEIARLISDNLRAAYEERRMSYPRVDQLVNDIMQSPSPMEYTLTSAALTQLGRVQDMHDSLVESWIAARASQAAGVNSVAKPLTRADINDLSAHPAVTTPKDNEPTVFAKPEKYRETKREPVMLEAEDYRPTLTSLLDYAHYAAMAEIVAKAEYESKIKGANTGDGLESEEPALEVTPVAFEGVSDSAAHIRALVRETLNSSDFMRALYEQFGSAYLIAFRRALRNVGNSAGFEPIQQWVTTFENDRTLRIGESHVLRPDRVILDDERGIDLSRPPAANS